MPADPAADDRRLAGALVAEGLIAPDALAGAVAEQRRLGGPERVRLARILVQRRLVAPAAITRLAGAPTPGSPPSPPPPPTLAASPPAPSRETIDTPLDLPAEVAAAMADPAARLGRYVLLGELGRGGMGVVHKGWDPGLRRHVAIKVVQGGARSQVSGERFVREARAAARLRHPRIVAVHEAGEHDGRPYIVMDFIAGETLADAIARDGRIEPRRAATLVREVAEALDHAHAHGIIHRDVKPQNVIIDRDGGSHLTDFGVARDVTAGADLTATGQLLGTPAYVAPEQLRGERGSAGPPADVYAAGGVLYHALTGRPPFQASSVPEIMVAALGQPPDPPRSIVREVPADLETITLRCLRKDPGARYASAGALADDLAAFLEGREIAARPQGALARLGRSARGNPVAALGAVALVAGIAALATAAAMLREPSGPPRTTATGSASAARPGPDGAEPGSGSAADVAPLAIPDAELPLPDGARRRIGSLQLRHGGAIDIVAVSPDGRRAVTIGGRILREWDLETLQSIRRVRITQRISEAVWGRDLIGILEDGRVERLTTTDERLVRQELVRVAEGHAVAAVSPDGETLYLGRREDGPVVTRVAAATGSIENVLRVARPRALLRAIVSAPSGERLAVVSELDGRTSIDLWDLTTSPARYDRAIAAGSGSGVAFAPGGDRLVTTGAEGTRAVAIADSRIETLDDAPGVSVLALPALDRVAVLGVDGRVAVIDPLDATKIQRLGPIPASDLGARMLAVPVGRILVAGRSGILHVVDPSAGTIVPVTGPSGHAAAVKAISVDLAGEAVVTASEDGTARVWRAGRDESLPPIQLGGPARHGAVAIDSAGGRVAVVTGRGDVAVHTVGGGEVPATIPMKGTAREVAISAEPRLVTRHPDGVTRHALDGALLQALEPKRDGAKGRSISAGRRITAALFGDRTLAIWDPSVEKPAILRLGADASRVVISPDDALVAALRPSGATVRDARSGAILGRFGVEGAGHASIALGPMTPGGDHVVALGLDDGRIAVWDVRSGQPRHLFVGHEGSVDALAIAGRGGVLVSGSADTTVIVWDLRGTAATRDAAAAELSTLTLERPLPEGAFLRLGTRRMRHGAPIRALSAAPDGLTAASAGGTAIRLWDLATGVERAELVGHRADVTALFHSGSANAIVSADRSGRVLGWYEGRTRPVHELSAGGVPVSKMAISPDSRWIAFAGGSGVRIFDTTTANDAWREREPSQVRKIVFTRDSTRLVVAYGRHDEPRGVVVRDAASGVVATRRALEAGAPVPLSVALTGDDRVVVTGQRSLIRAFALPGLTDAAPPFDPALQGLRPHLEIAPGGDLGVLWGRVGQLGFVGTPGPRIAHGDAAAGTTAVVFTREGERVVTGGVDGILRVYDPRTGERLDPAEGVGGHDGAVVGLAFAADDRLVSLGRDRTLRLWSLGEGKQSILEVDVAKAGHLDIAPAGDEVRLVTDDGGLAGAKIEDGTLRGPFEVDTTASPATAAVYAPREPSLAIAAADGRVVVFDLDSGEAVTLAGGPGSTPLRLAWSPNGGRIALAAGESGAIEVFDRRDGRRVRRIEGVGPIHDLAGLPARRVAVAGDAGLVIRRTDSDEPILDAPTPSPIRTLAVSRDGSLLAAAGDAGTIVVAAVEDESVRLIATLPGDGPRVTALAFAPGGAHLASATADGVITLWRASAWGH